MAPFVSILYPNSRGLSTAKENVLLQAWPLPFRVRNEYILAAPTGVIPFNRMGCIRHVPHFCHSDRSASGVEESTTLVKEPTQDKICYSGRFLDSFHSLGMTYRRGVPFNHTGYIRNVGGTAQTLLWGVYRKVKICNLIREIV